MKKILLITILLLLSIGVFAAPSLSVGVDLVSFDSFYYSNIAIRSEVSCFMSKDVRFSLPLALYIETSKNLYLNMANTGLFIDYFPLKDINFYAGVSLFDYYYMFGYDRPKNPHFITSSSRLGYILNLGIIDFDLRFQILDLVSASQDNAEILCDTFGQITKYKFSIVVSATFDKKENE